MQTTNYKDFYKSTKQTQHESTIKERDNLLTVGMQEITETELLQMLKNLNYKIDSSNCFNYFNSSNSTHYKARAMAYNDNKTGQSWAHCEQSLSNAQNQAELQKIRRNYFVFTAGRIWEL